MVPSSGARSVALLGVASVLAVLGCGGGGGGTAGKASGAAVGPSTSATTTSPPAPVASTAPATLPAGTFTRNFQGREYRLHVPANATAPLSLVLCFHGAGDDAGNFYDTLGVSGWVSAADKAGFALLVPATKSPYQDFAVWSGNPNNDFAAMQTELDSVLALVDQDVAKTWPIDAARTHALGFSDGGLFVGVVGLGQPRFATTTILGFGWGAFNLQPLTQKRPVHLACGTADSFYTRAVATQSFLATDGHDVLWEPAAGVGHTFIGISASIDPAKAIAWIAARPPTGTPPTTPPTTPPATPPGSGSGGTGGGKGLVTRPITTTAQAGIPSVTSSYDCYVPTGYDPAKPISVVIAANMGLTPWQALAQSETFIVVDFRDYDRNGGFNFDVDVACLDAVIRDVRAAWNVDLKRLYYHGFSAGAHWGYAVVLANGATFAGLGISAGSLQTAAQQGVFPAGVTRKLAVAIRHGTQDAVVPVSQGRTAATQLQGNGHPVQISEFAGGHTVAAQDAQAIWTFLKGYTLP